MKLWLKTSFFFFYTDLTKGTLTSTAITAIRQLGYYVTLVPTKLKWSRCSKSLKNPPRELPSGSKLIKLFFFFFGTPAAVDSNKQKHFLSISSNGASEPPLSVSPRLKTCHPPQPQKRLNCPPTISPLPGHRGCELFETHVQHHRFCASIQTNTHKIGGKQTQPRAPQRADGRRRHSRARGIKRARTQRQRTVARLKQQCPFFP